MTGHLISFTLNGTRVSVEVASRDSLADLLRDHLRMTSVHLGCEHGVCGACTVLADGEVVRSCITLAAACEGRVVQTLEGLRDDEFIQILSEAFTQTHGVQCGFCTPAMLIAARDILSRVPDANQQQIREMLGGNLCRCTGYGGIVDAIALAARRKGAER